MLYCLSNIAGATRAQRDALIKGGVFSRLASAVAKRKELSFDSALTETFIWFIENLVSLPKSDCLEPRQVAAGHQVEPLIPYIFDIFTKTENLLTTKACLTIFYFLSDFFNSFKDRFLESCFFIERLYQKLYHGDLVVRGFTLRVFCNLSNCERPELIGNMLKSELLDALREILAGTQNEVKCYALLILANLLIGTAEQKLFIIKHRVFAKLLELMTQPGLSEALTSEISYCIVNSTVDCSQDHLMALLRLNVFAPVFIMLDNFKASQKVVYRLTNSILRMIEKGQELDGAFSRNPVLNELANKEPEFVKYVNEVGVYHSTASTIMRELNAIEDFARSYQKPA